RYRRRGRRDALDVPAIGHRTGSAFLRNSQRFAERDAGGFGVDLGLAACIGDCLFASAVEQFRGVRHGKTDAADIVSAGANQRVDERTVTLDQPHFSGTYTLMTSLSSAVFSGSVMYSSMKVSLASSFLSSRWLVMAS